MKIPFSKLLFLVGFCFVVACGQDKNPYYDQILKSDEGQFRSAEIGASIESIKALEDSTFLREEISDYLHYDYTINMGNTYTVTYDFSEDDKLYEIEVAIFLDEIKDADALYNNFSDYFNRKYSIGQQEDDGYMTWHTKSTINQSRVAVSIINDSEAYGFLTILVRDLDY